MYLTNQEHILVLVIDQPKRFLLTFDLVDIESHPNTLLICLHATLIRNR